MAIPTPRDWTPRLSADGVYYCSPACGGCKFCTKAEYDTAVANAAKLAKQLGKGWEPGVWENLGWHYNATKARCSVHRHGAGRYTAYFNAKTMQFIGRSNTARKAVTDALEQAENAVREIGYDIYELKDTRGIA